MPALRSRRNFLKSAGAAAALSPFVSMIGESRARAAAPVKRALFVYVPDGCIPDRFFPTGTETSFSLPEMSSPLESITQHLTFIDGLSMYSGGATHEGGAAKVLTGVSAQSIDVFLGEAIGGATPFRSLQLGVGANFENGSGSISYVGENQQVTPDDDPLNAFARIFGSSSAPGQDLQQRRRKSVLDTALGDINQLRSRLGGTERQKLDIHLDSLREVESRLMGLGGSCDGSGFNNRGFQNIETDYYPKTYHKEEHFKTIGQMQMDLLALSLSCGATNVGTLMWSHAVSPTHIVETGIQTGNHDASHYGDVNGPLAADWIVLKQWFMRQFVYLINKLDSIPDEGGTLLDNTLVLLCSELGDSNLHDHDRVPFVLAGRAGGGLRSGRFLDYRGKNTHQNGGENEPHTKLLTSIANLMDVPIESYGYGGHGTGPLPGLV